VVAEAMTEEVLNVRLVEDKRRALRRDVCAKVALAADWKKFKGECILKERLQRAEEWKIY
jgi:hypothetical protein